MYKIDRQNVIYYNDNDPIEEIFLKIKLPINTSLIVRYLEPIVEHICKKFGSEERAQEEAKCFENMFKSNPDGKTLPDYKIGDNSFLECLKGDYNFLKQKFIIEDRYVPDINNFVNNFTYPQTTLTYPFSLKELYDMIVEKGIKVLIHNYFISDK